MPNTQRIVANGKLERIDLRTTPAIKSSLQYAAHLVGMTVSTFLLTSAFEKAKELLQQQESLRLSNEERDKFIALLESSPSPKHKLKVAMQKFLAGK